MICKNVNCKYYIKPSKATYIERYNKRVFGFPILNLGGCNKPYCKLEMKKHIKMSR